MLRCHLKLPMNRLIENGLSEAVNTGWIAQRLPPRLQRDGQQDWRQCLTLSAAARDHLAILTSRSCVRESCVIARLVEHLSAQLFDVSRAPIGAPSEPDVAGRASPNV